MTAVGETKERCAEKMRTILNDEVDHDKILDVYHNWASSYDEDLSSVNYAAPQLVADTISNSFPNMADRSSVNVLDVAAGTGLVGVQLHELGFTQIDALEPNSEMIKILKSKNVYRHIINETIGYKQTSIPSNEYDVVTIAGGFVQGHCPVQAFEEMIKVCKKGGMVVNSMRYEYLWTVPEYRRLEQYTSSLEQKGLWKLHSRIITPHYFEVKEGITFKWIKL